MRNPHTRISLVIALAWRLLATWLSALRTDERSKSRDKACFGYALRGGGSPKGNSDGNTNVRFHQKDTLKRFFERFEQKGLTVNRFRADCGSCSEEIVEEVRTQSNKPHQGVCLQVHLGAGQMDKDIKAVSAEYLFMQQCLCQCVPEWLWITPTTYGYDSAYCLKSHGGVRGMYMSLW